MGKRVVLLMFCLVSSAPGAYAQQKSSGDFFTDQGFYVDERPLGMNAQRFHRNDMFGRSQPYATIDKDMFDHTNHANDYGSADMFAGSLHRKDVPEEPLFQWPSKKQ